VSKLTEWAEGLSLSTGGRKLVGKAGIMPVRRLADRVGLTDALSAALVRRDFHPVHDRGGVLVSAACAVLLGARSIAGIDVMRQAALVLGHPASASTLYRTLDGIGPVQLAKITSARAKVRSRVHDLLDLRPGGFPWIRVDGRPLTGWTVLDIDASLVPAHSDKEGAEPNRKGFGLHPILMFLDNTDEHLVCRLPPGSAGANTASDHIEVSSEAIRQLPTRRRRKVLFRADGAGATREYLQWITGGGGNRANTWQYSVGWTRDDDFWSNLAKVPEKTWTAALDAKGKPREDAALVEITGMLDLEGWPQGLPGLRAGAQGQELLLGVVGGLDDQQAAGGGGVVLVVDARVTRDGAGVAGDFEGGAVDQGGHYQVLAVVADPDLLSGQGVRDRVADLVDLDGGLLLVNLAGLPERGGVGSLGDRVQPQPLFGQGLDRDLAGLAGAGGS